MCATTGAKSWNTSGVGLTLADLPPIEAGRIDPRTWFDDPTGGATTRPGSAGESCESTADLHLQRPLELEIGSGKGTFLVQHAPLHPEVNFLGIEWAGEFFRYAADRIRRNGITNVKVLHADASEFFRHRLPDGIVRTIHLYFSDPWPKKRHHKRRVIQDQTLVEFHRVLEPSGRVHLVTDHDELWAWYEEHIARAAHLFERREFQPPESAREGEVVGSNFERKYQREGRVFKGMTLLRLP